MADEPILGDQPYAPFIIPALDAVIGTPAWEQSVRESVETLAAQGVTVSEIGDHFAAAVKAGSVQASALRLAYVDRAITGSDHVHEIVETEGSLILHSRNVEPGDQVQVQPVTRALCLCGWAQITPNGEMRWCTVVEVDHEPGQPVVVTDDHRLIDDTRLVDTEPQYRPVHVDCAMCRRLAALRDEQEGLDPDE